MDFLAHKNMHSRVSLTRKSELCNMSCISNHKVYCTFWSFIADSSRSFWPLYCLLRHKSFYFYRPCLRPLPYQIWMRLYYYISPYIRLKGGQNKGSLLSHFLVHFCQTCTTILVPSLLLVYKVNDADVSQSVALLAANIVVYSQTMGPRPMSPRNHSFVVMITHQQQSLLIILKGALFS